jgi:hypothetical protein
MHRTVQKSQGCPQPHWAVLPGTSPSFNPTGCRSMTTHLSEKGADGGSRELASFDGPAASGGRTPRPAATGWPALGTGFLLLARRSATESPVLGSRPGTRISPSGSSTPPGPARTLGKTGWRGNAFCERILRVTFGVVHERTLHACSRSTDMRKRGVVHFRRRVRSAGQNRARPKSAALPW